MILDYSSIVKDRRTATSRLIDQTILQEEKHIAAVTYHAEQARRARLIRAELERLIPVAVGTAAVWEMCHG